MGHEKQLEDDMLAAANDVDMNNIRKGSGGFINIKELSQLPLSWSMKMHLSYLLDNNPVKDMSGILSSPDDTPLQSAAIEGLYDFLLHKNEFTRQFNIVDFEDIRFVLFDTDKYCIAFKTEFADKVHSIIDQHIF